MRAAQPAAAAAAAGAAGAASVDDVEAALLPVEPARQATETEREEARQAVRRRSQALLAELVGGAERAGNVRTEHAVVCVTPPRLEPSPSFHRPFE